MISDHIGALPPKSGRQQSWFPGRWLGAASLILAPLLLLAGILLRIRFHFFFPQQLAAYHDHPVLMTVAYNCFLAGNILLWPAVLNFDLSVVASWGR